MERFVEQRDGDQDDAMNDLFGILRDAEDAGTQFRMSRPDAGLDQVRSEACRLWPEDQHELVRLSFQLGWAISLHH